MKTFEQLAQEAYEIYGREQKTLGIQLVLWRKLPEINRQSWIAATRHIVEQANQVH